ncbi:hypothetical protein BDR26DRAFT_936465 [Obelidium mucronatum]|nr:hypothetical protein BDR26DRAFT_936465 [Obelidium mucronatum]
MPLPLKCLGIQRTQILTVTIPANTSIPPASSPQRLDSTNYKFSTSASNCKANNGLLQLSQKIYSSLTGQIEHLLRMLAGIGPGEAAKEAALKGKFHKIPERQKMVALVIQKRLLQFGQLKGDSAGVMAAIGPEVEVPAPTPTVSWQRVGQTASNPANPIMSSGSAICNEQRQRMAPIAPWNSLRRLAKSATTSANSGLRLMAGVRGLNDQWQSNLLDASPAIADYGGIEVDKIYSVVPRVKKVSKYNLAAELYDIAMSLQSPSPIEIAYSLNVLTVLSNDKDVILRIPGLSPTWIRSH